eukprot:CAMPEP_0179167682 /NCGR_PEP_ID=MMETSP0796-20121207/82456_1 /TAXON_ID=73915 /ORGANISM="Pyrodinium bahamense, Strain pbaha01" /LENGTH=116 /DNA_ID=CAMNT_0020870401 /DNA_START=6 /DNA_END=353 /DNA_ORIENTATION=+
MAADGQNLMQCTLTPVDWSKAELHRVAVLRAAGPPGGGAVGKGPLPPLLAYCKAGAIESGACRIAYIYDAQDELFAQMVEEPGGQACYVLVSGHIGLHLVFHGNFSEHQVWVTNER